MKNSGVRAGAGDSLKGRLPAPASILVVEDDSSVRQVLRVILELEGHRVTAAANVASAADLFATAEVDAVVLDVNLPDGSGLELLRLIRSERGDSVRVIVLSGFKQEDVAVRALEQGADDFVTKPFGPRELVARLNRRLAG